MEISYLGLFQGVSLPAHCPTVVSTCYSLLWEEASLTMAKQSTDLWVQQNFVRSHLIALFFIRVVVFGFLHHSEVRDCGRRSCRGFMFS